MAARKNKKQRAWILGGSFVSLSIAVFIILSVFQDNLVFFFSPSEIAEKNFSEDRRIRVGGLVEEGSVKKYMNKNALTEFLITDLNKSIKVSYKGVLPTLFREGQGMVAEGYMKDGVFEAKTLLSKHDEKYMPPEVADALKKTGQWKGE